jgi:oligopeptide transport system permease protein
VTRFILGRVLAMIPVLFFVSVITFTVMHLTPGGPFDTERRIPEAQRANIERKYGLDKPPIVQYLDYMAGAVRGDLGPSYRDTRRTVTEIILDGLPVTAQLALYAIVLGMIVGIPLGLLSALKRNTIFDYMGVAFSVGGYSVPNYVLAVVMIIVFSANLHWLPSSTWGTPLHAIMPTIALATAPAAILARYTRATVLDVFRQDFVRTARAKGVREQWVVIRHMIPNAMIPVVTVLGPLAAGLIAGSFIIETMFSIPGIGRLFVAAVAQRDYPVIMGATLFYALLIAAMNLIVDVLYVVLDPRIRF